MYFFSLASYDEDEVLKLKESEVRPRARTKLTFDEVTDLFLIQW